MILKKSDQINNSTIIKQVENTIHKMFIHTRIFNKHFL